MEGGERPFHLLAPILFVVINIYAIRGGNGRTFSQTQIAVTLEM